MHSKAQLKIQEMAFVLLAVVLLFALIFVFLARFQYAQLEKTATELRQEKTTNMLRVVASMPELACSGKALCIDEDKLEAFKLVKNKYSELWQESSIVKVAIEEVFPKGKEFAIYNEPSQASQGKLTYATFVSLCQEGITKTCKIAKIKITMAVP